MPQSRQQLASYTASQKYAFQKCRKIEKVREVLSCRTINCFDRVDRAIVCVEYSFVGIARRRHRTTEGRLQRDALACC